MSASSDHCLRVWDLRQPKRQSMLSVTAHDQDVNVCSWNRYTTTHTERDDRVFGKSKGHVSGGTRRRRIKRAEDLQRQNWEVERD